MSTSLLCNVNYMGAKHMTHGRDTRTDGGCIMAHLRGGDMDSIASAYARPTKDTVLLVICLLHNSNTFVGLQNIRCQGAACSLIQHKIRSA